MKIGILGTGNIGATLGKKWAAKGHQIRFGVRDVHDPRYEAVLETVKGQVKLASLGEAIAFGAVVLFAVPGTAVDEIVAAHGSALDGKIVIDAANKVRQPEMNSLAAIAAKAPQASLFRAFNSLGWENFDQPELGGVQIDLFFCGDSGEARQAVTGLIADIGLRPVYVGGREQVQVVDNLTRLWFSLAFEQDLGRRLAFKMLTE